MKITVDIADALLIRAKRHARRRGRSVRALIEEGLRRVLDAEEPGAPYRLPDLSVGNPRASDPLEALSWRHLRDDIYRGR